MKMSRPIIEKLPVELANLIAAGEVVERPASVVKELVENSIDAQGNVIRIDLIDYGLKKISVLDNGIGMSESDIDLAILPQATSKIKKQDDLFAIKTLGFRGEALPSINRVSKMQITSSIDGYNGICKSYTAGVCYKTKHVPFTKGTQIEVSDLFFNTPARLKHLGSNQLELSHIISFVNRQSLAYPQISFTLTNNGKVLFSTTGDEDYKMIIRSIYGQDVAKNMLELNGDNGLYKILGYTSSNSVFRSNRNSITLIVNKRVIKNLSLVYAITDAYKTYLPIGKFPITILEIIGDETLVDVNVHPTKQEVRFTDEFRLKELVTKTIVQTLQSVELIYSQDLHNAKIQMDIQTKASSLPISKKEENRKASYEWDDFPTTTPVMPQRETEVDRKEKEDTKDTIEDKKEEIDFSYDMKTPNPFREMDYRKDIVEQQTFAFREESSRFFSTMTYLGQYNKTYLLFEKDEDLYLLDQHAGMERFMYEMISKKFGEESTSTMELLIPLKIEIPLYEIELVLKKKNDFEKLGIQFDYFGANTLLIRVIPTWIPEGLQVEFITDIINYIVNNQKVSKDVLFDNLAKMLSCKKSIKANMNILDIEVQSLLEKLDACKNPFTCPHGRPTIIKFTKYEIEKLFKRVL